MNSDYDDVPDYVKIGIENAKKVKLEPAPNPPVIKPKVSLRRGHIAKEQKLLKTLPYSLNLQYNKDQLL